MLNQEVEIVVDAAAPIEMKGVLQESDPMEVLAERLDVGNLLKPSTRSAIGEARRENHSADLEHGVGWCEEPVLLQLKPPATAVPELSHWVLHGILE